MEINDLLNKTLYYIPHDFIDNCCKGIKTPIYHIKITGPIIEESSRFAQYEINSEEGGTWLTTKQNILKLVNVKIGGKIPSIFGGQETIYSGIYQTLEEAKHQMKNYINKELKKIEKSIKSLEERSENFNKCLW